MVCSYHPAPEIVNSPSSFYPQVPIVQGFSWKIDTLLYESFHNKCFGEALDRRDDMMDKVVNKDKMRVNKTCEVLLAESFIEGAHSKHEAILCWLHL